MTVIIAAFSFCSEGKDKTPYGVSCLVSAFRHGLDGKKSACDDKIFTCIFDMAGGTLDAATVARRILQEVRDKGCDVLGFSNFVWASDLIKQAGQMIRDECPCLKIIMGGPMVAATREEIAAGYSRGLHEEYPFVDQFIYSFGEKVFASLQSYLDSGKCLINAPMTDEEYKTLVSPYLVGQIALSHGMTCQWETRRGCSFSCSYCRHRSQHDNKVHIVRNAILWRKELALFKAHGIKKINVIDPLFNTQKPHRVMPNGECAVDGLGVLQIIAEAETNAKISLQMRPETLCDDYSSLASSMGNVTFEVGVQSLDAKVLTAIGRGNDTTPHIVLERLKRAQAYNNVNIEVTLIYGLPYQTYKSFLSDVEMLRTVGVSKITAFPLQLYPGTVIIEDYVKYGLAAEKEAAYGILQVADNSAHDFDKMRQLADSLNP